MQITKIKWIDSAKNDLREINTYITSQSPKFAKIQIQRIFEQVDKLKQFPFIGLVLPEHNDENIRYILFGAYRIIYLLIENEVHIIRVWHNARDFNPEDDL